MNEQLAAQHKETAKQNIITAAHEFFCVSPRYCELKDKQRNGVFMDSDETQELRWLEVLSLNLNIYLQ